MLELEYITVDMHDLVLGSFAVAFLALSQQPASVWTAELASTVHGVLTTFKNYVVQKGDGIRFAGQVAVDEAEKRLIVTPKAMKSVAGSVQELVGDGRLPFAGDFVGLVEALKDVCRDETAFSDAFDIFDALGTVEFSQTQPVPRPPMRVDEYNNLEETSGFSGDNLYVEVNNVHGTGRRPLREPDTIAWGGRRRMVGKTFCVDGTVS